MNRKETNGRFALVENLADENAFILVFEIPHFVTGENLAVVGCFGVGTVQEMEVGDVRDAHFDARSVLTFDEEIAARSKSDVMMLHVGYYQGTGVLCNENNCDFVFSSDVLAGKWWLGQAPRKCRKGFISKIFGHMCLILERTE